MRKLLPEAISLDPELLDYLSAKTVNIFYQKRGQKIFYKDGQYFNKNKVSVSRTSMLMNDDIIRGINSIYKLRHVDPTLVYEFSSIDGELYLQNIRDRNWMFLTSASSYSTMAANEGLIVLPPKLDHKLRMEEILNSGLSLSAEHADSAIITDFKNINYRVNFTDNKKKETEINKFSMALKVYGREIVEAVNKLEGDTEVKKAYELISKMPGIFNLLNDLSQNDFSLSDISLNLLSKDEYEVHKKSPYKGLFKIGLMAVTGKFNFYGRN